MKASHLWLTELSGVDESPDAVAAALTRLGLEVLRLAHPAHLLVAREGPQDPVDQLPLDLAAAARGDGDERRRRILRDGDVELRRVPDPGDEALRPEEIAKEQQRPQPVPPPGARPADEVLFEHHELMRRLFERIADMSPTDPERRDLMRVLAGELQIHEHVEDEIFYPEVRPVSEDVPAAHAEHQQLADMLAVVLRLSPSDPEFEAQLRSLHEAVDHHATAEERSMFVDARRLGDARLREMGARIEAMLDEERASLARRSWRDLKIRLLEGV